MATNIIAQNNNRFDSLYNYCIENKIFNKNETLKNFETLKNIIQNDTNYLHKAKFYFLDFILSSKLKKSTDFDTNTTYNYTIIDTTKNINNLINIANQLTLDGNTEKSIKLLNKAISLCKSKDSLNYINTININLAEAYRKNFEYKKAIYLLNNVIYNKDVSQKELAHAYNPKNSGLKN